MTGSKSKSSAGLRIANQTSSLSAEIFVAFAASAALAPPKAVAPVRQGLSHGLRCQRTPGSAMELLQFPFPRGAQRMLSPCSLSRDNSLTSDHSSFSPCFHNCLTQRVKVELFVLHGLFLCSNKPTKKRVQSNPAAGPRCCFPSGTLQRSSLNFKTLDIFVRLELISTSL